MGKIQREDIEIIARHSNWSEKGIESYLKKDIYNGKTAWQNFLRIFFISAGVAFSTAGVIFFFAYNWADLHKFIKIGLIEVSIVVFTLFIVVSKASSDIKNIVLTGVSILVGVLFAVFGQIYQTGADAYDFFLGWTLFISIWALISNFAPLWLVYITLINTTVVLYSEQVSNNWSFSFVCTILFLINFLFLLAFIITKQNKPKVNIPIWFLNVLALFTVCCCSVGIVYNILESGDISIYFLLIFTTLAYIFGIKYGLKVKSGFYLSIIPFSIVIIISAFLIKISDDSGMFLFVGLFIVASITVLILFLNKLQKEWTK